MRKPPSRAGRRCVAAAQKPPCRVMRRTAQRRRGRFYGTAVRRPAEAAAARERARASCIRLSSRHLPPPAAGHSHLPPPRRSSRGGTAAPTHCAGRRRPHADSGDAAADARGQIACSRRRAGGPPGLALPPSPPVSSHRSLSLSQCTSGEPCTSGTPSQCTSSHQGRFTRGL